MKHILVLSVCSMAIATSAIAEPTEEGEAVVQRWVDAFNAGRAEEVAALFHPQALVWGTVSPSLATTEQAVKTYFVAALSRPISVNLRTRTARTIADNVVVVAGDYDFVRPETTSGPAMTITARYDFTVVKGETGWKIATFHSSRKP